MEKCACLNLHANKIFSLHILVSPQEDSPPASIFQLPYTKQRKYRQDSVLAIQKYIRPYHLLCTQFSAHKGSLTTQVSYHCYILMEKDLRARDLLQKFPLRLILKTTNKNGRHLSQEAPCTCAS